ncbi:MAG: hypothetical protein M0000_01790 [Actinomycetota bacterium]|nr:hypothetical protein [Actinomycetota bacterium]
MDTVAAICPNCRILVVEWSSNSMSKLAAAIAHAGSHAQVASDSCGGSEFITETNCDKYYPRTGVTNAASSGDNGYGVYIRPPLRMSSRPTERHPPRALSVATKK